MTTTTATHVSGAEHAALEARYQERVTALERDLVVARAEARRVREAGLELERSCEELKGRLRHLAALEQRKSESLLGLGQKLRAALGALRNGIDLLAHTGSDDERQRFAHGLVHEQIRELSRTVDDLLDVTRARGGVPDFQGGLRVLVVDDNSDAAMALGMLLDAASCAVETALSGRAALEKARAFQPDVVLCDIGLPDLTGFDVAEALRADERSRGALLVAVTGFGHDDVAGRVKQSGFDLHLLKPVDPDVLFDLLTGARKALSF